MRLRFILARGAARYEWQTESIFVPRQGDRVGHVDEEDIYRKGVVTSIHWIYQDTTLIGANIFCEEIK